MANTTTAFPQPFSFQIQFDRGKVLGVGHSFVYQGTYKGQEVAVKRIVLNPSITEDDDNLKAQMQLAHENVLKIVTIEENADFRYIVLELCSASLFQVIEKTYKGPPLPPDNDVMFQIANGLYYIHSQNLVHGNIKPENILISMDGQMKLSEFGLRKPREEKCFISGLKGTLLWMAPECLPSKSNETNTKRNPESDVFSCGCVYFVFLTRENGRIHPFGDIIDHLQIHVNIREGKPINIHRLQNNHSVEELIQKMIQHNPIKRITSNEVKNRLSQISNDQRCNSSKKPSPSLYGKRDLVYRFSVTRQRILAPAKQAALSDNSLPKLLKISNNYDARHSLSNFSSKTHRLSKDIVNAMGQGESEFKLNGCGSEQRPRTSPLGKKF